MSAALSLQAGQRFNSQDKYLSEAASTSRTVFSTWFLQKNYSHFVARSVPNFPLELAGIDLIKREYFTNLAGCFDRSGYVLTKFFENTFPGWLYDNLPLKRRATALARLINSVNSASTLLAFTAPSKGLTRVVHHNEIGSLNMETVFDTDLRPVSGGPTDVTSKVIHNRNKAIMDRLPHYRAVLKSYEKEAAKPFYKRWISHPHNYKWVGALGVSLMVYDLYSSQREDGRRRGQNSLTIGRTTLATTASMIGGTVGSKVAGFAGATIGTIAGKVIVDAVYNYFPSRRFATLLNNDTVGQSRKPQQLIASALYKFSTEQDTERKADRVLS